MQAVSTNHEAGMVNMTLSRGTSAPWPTRLDGAPARARQAGGAAFAVLLLAVFALTSVAGGGGGGAPSSSSSSGAAPRLSEQQRQELQGQAQRFADQLAASPDSVEALEVS
jgi:hypothetical protein